MIDPNPSLSLQRPHALTHRRPRLHRAGPSRHRALWIALSLALLFQVAATDARAQVTGISYTLSPVGARLSFSGDAGLSTAFLYGGELGLGFGEFLEVDGIYLLGNDFETDFSDFSNGLLSDDVADKEAALTALAGLSTREVNVRRYGAKLRVNLARGSIIPFVSAGTGILRIDPQDLEASEHIYANVGVGLSFSLADRYTVSVAAENLAYRYNPASTFLTDADLEAAALTRDHFSQQTVNNPVVSASLKFFLGGRSSEGLTDIDRALLSQFRGGNFRVAVEPFYGQINFNSALGFPDSRAVAGVNAGFDLGPYIGLRAFYWRDTEQKTVFKDGLPGGLGKLAFYGGELDLRFDTQFSGRSLTPYLIVGGGYMDVGEKADFFAADGVLPESRYFAMGGGGVELPLTSSIKVQGGVRGLFMSTEDIEAVSAPASIHANLMYTAGINFNIGGSGRTLGTAVEQEMATVRAEDQVRSDAMGKELARIQARLDSLETVRAVMPDPEPTLTSIDPALVVEHDAVVASTLPTRNLSGQTLTIPVPSEGEIYLRFGTAPASPAPPVIYPQPMVIGLPTTPVMTSPAVIPATVQSTMIPDRTDTASVGSLTAGQVQQIVRQALAEQQTQTQPGTLTAEQLDERLRRMEDRIQQHFVQESNRLRNDMAEQPSEVRVVREDGTPATSPATQRRRGMLSTFGQRQLVSILPLVGLRMDAGPTQFLVGVRGDYRFPGKSYRFMPEIGLSFGENERVGINTFANVAWAPFDLSSVRPYAGTGAGFISDSGLKGLNLTLNVFAGLEYTIPQGSTFFGEFSTLDLFDVNRLIVGYRLRL